MIGGFVLLYFGAEGLVRGGAALALRAGMRPLVVGLTVVAFGTSSPELVVSLDAAFAGAGNLAVGNVVGSNICNVALILGLAALIRPMRVQVQLIRLEVPIVIACSILLAIFLLDERLGRLEGLLLFLGIIGYLAFSLRQVHKERKTVKEETLGALPSHLWHDVAFVIGGVVILVIGARLFVDGAVRLAQSWGVSEAVIGLTIVAVGTSLPELATSVVAAIKKEGDIAIGNVVGSNIFNILAILGISALVVPLRAGGVGLVDLGVMIGLVLLLLPLMRTGFSIDRWEGALLLAAYVGYVAYLVN